MATRTVRYTIILEDETVTAPSLREARSIAASAILHGGTAVIYKERRTSWDWIQEGKVSLASPKPKHNPAAEATRRAKANQNPKSGRFKRVLAFNKARAEVARAWAAQYSFASPASTPGHSERLYQAIHAFEKLGATSAEISAAMDAGLSMSMKAPKQNPGPKMILIEARRSVSQPWQPAATTHDPKIARLFARCLVQRGLHVRAVK